MRRKQTECEPMNEMTDAPIKLRWEGPFTCSELLRSTDNKKQFSVPGVYLWTDTRIVENESRDVLTYVGKASGSPTLWYRQADHYFHIISGYYKIPAQYRVCKQPWGLDYNKPESFDVLFDLERYQQLVREAFASASQMRIFLCPCDLDVKVVERNLLYDLCPTDTTMGTKTEPPQPMAFVHQDAKWATKSVREQIRDYVQFAPP